ncbi:uncharacterized protein LOC120781667 isoform X1 [Bactrocera tryoni]|uniref:uncharacterized protein LOC120781667 isoform X1 n=1 Tax=Bactrocera tryoni TaxID=59916 RepID=UPI001A96D80A|nr:uncharacterized protein LOC120781667 isoform X1 [Bactrocera tryoni]
MEKSDTDSEYQSGALGPPTKKKLRTEIVHKKCVTTDSRQDFKPSETQSIDNESRRGLPLQIIGDIVIEHDNNQMEVNDGNLTIDHVQKPRQLIEVRLNKAPKTSAERGRDFRARKALLKQQCKQQQEPDAIVEIANDTSNIITSNMDILLRHIREVDIGQSSIGDICAAHCVLDDGTNIIMKTYDLWSSRF